VPLASRKPVGLSVKRFLHLGGGDVHSAFRKLQSSEGSNANGVSFFHLKTDVFIREKIQDVPLEPLDEVS